jgi:signal transduction histidine kinase
VRLRTRLALTLGLAVIPLAVALALLQQWRRHEAEVELVRESVVARMEAGGREVCEAEPERFRGRARGPGAGPGQGTAGASRRATGCHGAPGGAGHGGARALCARRDQRARRASAAGRAARGGARWRDGGQPPRAWPRRAATVRSAGGHALERWALCADPDARARCTRDAAVASALTGVGVGFAAVLVAWLAAVPLVRRLRRLEDAAARGPGKSAVAMVGGSDEVTAVARALDADRERIDAQVTQLQQRDAALVAYIANTTHDVMLPLTVLQGHLVAAREQLAKAASNSASVDETLRLAVEESDYLGSLLRNLNARARLDAASDARVREPVDLVALVERVIARHRMIARDRRVSLDFAVPDEPTLALGDVTLLERALSNVVHNAVRYNDAGGHVAVVLSAKPGAFTLRVTDDGPGLDPEDLPRLTERGYRGNVARTRHPHGMGLGLHITEDVLTQHGFTLRIARPEGAERGLEVLISGPTTEAR